ncbi:hypothetical protein [Helicobacter sp. MIT 05-5294]|nr:hypothetical protein [Helicobacter sp. MIT 05-5294]
MVRIAVERGIPNNKAESFRARFHAWIALALPRNDRNSRILD